MASTYERSSNQIIYKAAKTRPFPQVDLLTLLFDSDVCRAKEDTVLHADAADPRKSVTKSQLRGLVTSTAHVFRHRYGIGTNGPNKDVALCIGSGHFLMPTLFYSTVAAGGVFSASNPGSTPKELAGQLNQIHAKLLFCTEDTKPTAIAAAKLVNMPLNRVLLFSTSPSGTLALAEADSSSPVPISPQHHHPWARMTSTPELEESIICVLFSSGTTGPPKGCRLSHTNMISEAVLVLDNILDFYTARGLTMEWRTIAHLPAAHIAGIQGYLVNQFYAGGTVYWMPRFDFLQFLENAKKYRMTSFFSVPPIFLAIAKSPLVTDQFDTIEYAVSGAAPMGKELQAAAKAKLGKGKASLSQTWGLSETTGSITAMPKEWSDAHGDDLTGSVAMLVPNATARIVDDDERDVEPGQSGEIWVKGPQVVKGYWENDAANKDSFSEDGWFRTGDVGVFKGGLFYIVDRKKELIKYKGNQVAPAELEALLTTHPKIMDAAVIGVDAQDTEVPRAYIVPVDPKAITEQEIIDWVAKQVSNHKKLRGGVVFLPIIPRSPSGKILRKDLRVLAKQQDGKVTASKL